MSGIDLSAAVEAGHRALCAKYQQHPNDYPSYRSDVTAVLAEVRPLIEAAVREQVAREIEAGLPEARRRREDWIQRQDPDRVLAFTSAIDAIETCARIARGEQR